MGDTREWAADKEADFGFLSEKIKNDESAYVISLKAKELIESSDNLRLTKKQRNDLENMIDRLVDVVNDILEINMNDYIPSTKEVIKVLE